MELDVHEAIHEVGDAFNAAHYQWHQMADNHGDPDGMRYSFSSFIQEARNVTFRLQSLKQSFPGFEQWYEPWQRAFAASPLMKWANDTRVQVTKRGGVKTNSVAVATVYHSYNDPALLVLDADPFEHDLVIVRRAFDQIPAAAAPHCSIELRRRWIADDAPDGDLLTLTMKVLQHLRAMLDSLEDLSVGAPTRLPFEYLSRIDMLGCLKEMREPHVAIYQADGSEVQIKQTRRTSDMDKKKFTREMKKLRRKTGMDVPRLTVEPDTPMPDFVDRLFELAQAFVVGHGYYLPVLWLHRPDVGWQFEMVELEDRAAKYLFFHALGTRVSREGIDAVIYGSEAWTVFDNALLSQPYPDIAGHPNRMEAISVTGADSSGRRHSMSQAFGRDKKDRPYLHEEVEIDALDTTGGFLRPVLQAWGLVDEPEPK